MKSYADYMGLEGEQIMKFCLGENWRSCSIKESMLLFNIALDLDLTENMEIEDSFVKIQKKYEWLFCKYRFREVLFEKIHPLLKYER